MKAIETFYNGYRFRSRLEARWAVFFDALGVKYEYEPEGFVLSDGTYYLPDFYLPEFKYWVEVKGQLDEESKKKIDLFRNELGAETWLWVLGNIPDEDFFGDGECGDYCVGAEEIFSIGNSIGWDAPYLPCVCHTCGKIGIEFDGRSSRICRHDKDDKGYTANDERILNAYRKARTARFEHGEIPKPKILNFFPIEDIEGNNIIIRPHENGYTITHPHFHEKSKIFTYLQVASVFVLSIGGKEKLREFVSWSQAVRGR